MNKYLNGVLLVILVVLGCWFYFYEYKGSEKRQAVKQEAARLFPKATPSAASRLSFTRQATADDPSLAETLTPVVYSFARDDEDWMMTEPIHTLADTNKISTLVNQICDLKYDRVISEVPSDRDKYGLNPWSFEIRLYLKSDNESDIESICRFGDENPSRTGFYAEVVGQSKIYLIPNDVKIMLTKDTYTYRDKHLITFNPMEADSINVDCPTAVSYHLMKCEGEWLIDIPERTKADQARINEFISLLQAHEIAGFVDENPKGYGHFGLLSPYMILTFLDQESAKESQLIVGSLTDASGKFRYAKHSKFVNVFKIETDLLDRIPQTMFEIRDKSVCQFERERVGRIELHSPKGDFVLIRENNSDWVLTSPHRLDADDLQVGALLSDLAFLKATGLKPTEAEFGESYAKILLSDPDTDTKIVQLIIGEHPADGVGRWAKTNLEDTVFRISDSDIDRLLKNELELRNKELISVERNEIKEITIKKPECTLILVPDLDGWTIIEPKNADIDEEILDNLFWAIYRLKYDTIESEDISHLEIFGLDEPQTTLEIKLSDKSIGPIRFGNPIINSDSIYAYQEDSGIIVGIHKKTVENLRQFSCNKLK